MSEQTPPVRVNDAVTENPWQRLRAFTAARIALGRAGVSLPTRELLNFQLSHAQARDAVLAPLDVSRLVADLRVVNDSAPLCLHSQAVDRAHYLQRPDLGRLLDAASAEQLASLSVAATTTQHDLAVVIADGLSSMAVQQHAAPMLAALLSLLKGDRTPWQLAPLTLVEQGRVAIGDPIGECLNARAVLVLIGERPGLSSPDSLGLYLTWQPQPGLTDAARNCISNVRPAGLSYAEAARRTHYLLQQARELRCSGVQLKDRSPDAVVATLTQSRSFLLDP